MRRLHERILRADPSLLSLPEPGSGGTHAATAVVPRQLPAGTAHFAGRAAELTELAGLLDEPASAAAQVIVVIGGTPGIGKTALAVHWAHRVTRQFPDGQLYVNLRGFDPSGPPVSTTQALRGFLDALSVPATRIPAGAEEQASLYRSLLAGKRMLIVLDNARDEQQVRPLIPGEPGCRAVVTSRNELTGLVASHGAHCLTLDVLAEGEARDLLARRLGTERLAAEPDSVAEVIGYCARLPLALAIAAARAAAGPRLSVAGLASELRDSQRLLDALHLTDATMSVRGVFAWSFSALSTDAARLFRLLGVGPGPDISVAAATSLSGYPADRARELLGELTRACLLTEHVPGRFTCHDLLRTYAAELSLREESPASRHSALHRLLDHYLHSAYGAAMLLNSVRRPIALPPPQPGVAPEIFAGYDPALAWLETERTVLAGAVGRAQEHHFDRYAWQLPWTLSDYFSYRGHWTEWRAVQQIAVPAAARSGDLSGQAVALRHLGQAEASLGDNDEARRHMEQSIPFYGAIEDNVGLAASHLDCARVCTFQGQFADAVGHARQGLEFARAAGEPNGIATALNGVGWCLGQNGEYEQALTHCEEALAWHRELGNSYGQTTALDSIGYAHQHLGNHEQAIPCFHAAIEGFVKLGDRWLQANTLTHLGDAQFAAGDRASAAEAWRQALVIMEELQHPEVNQVRAKLSATKPSDTKPSDTKPSDAKPSGESVLAGHPASRTTGVP